MGRFGALMTGALLLAALGTGGCSGERPPQSAQAQTTPGTEATPPTATCAATDPRLPGTGLCAAEAAALMGSSFSSAPGDLPEGCSWTVGEAMLPGDEALLYQAATCGTKTTALEFRGGAQTATLGYVSSALFADNDPAAEPVRLVSLFEVADARARILEFARAAVEDPAEAEACAVRAAGGVGPGDALVVDASAAWREAKGLDGQAYDYSACGPYGTINDATRYWRIVPGYALFFDLGQDGPDFNPGSLTPVVRGPDGTWAARP